MAQPLVLANIWWMFFVLARVQTPGTVEVAVALLGALSLALRTLVRLQEEDESE